MGGKCLDKKYLDHWKPYKLWLTLVFLQEYSPNKHLYLLRQVLYAIAPQGQVQNQVGRLITKGHKIWEWQYNEDAMKVFHLKGMVMVMYKPSLVRNYANQPNCWMRSRIDVPQVDQGKICSMKDVALAVKSIISLSP